MQQLHFRRNDRSASESQITNAAMAIVVATNRDPRIVIDAELFLANLPSVDVRRHDLVLHVHAVVQERHVASFPHRWIDRVRAKLFPKIAAVEELHVPSCHHPLATDADRRVSPTSGSGYFAIKLVIPLQWALEIEKVICVSRNFGNASVGGTPAGDRHAPTSRIRSHFVNGSPLLQS